MLLKDYQNFRAYKMGIAMPSTIAEITKTQSRFENLKTVKPKKVKIKRAITTVICANSTPTANEKSGKSLPASFPTKILK